LRSHYRHQAQRGREARPFAEAVSDVDSPYVALSLYWQRLAPYVERFPAEQLCVVRFEDLVSDDAPGWDQVLAHLGLLGRQRSSSQHNVTADKPQFTKLFLRQWERNRLAWARPLPQPVRRLGRRLTTRNGRRYRAQLEQSETAALPGPIAEALAGDSARLGEWLGRAAPLW
jgi:hypothetical protein